ncbi:RDD family protein [Brachybacterium sp. AOP29-B2-41]|uniref:RDD family protein n=1 Tax=Brachybacterium sp. AOP29-B2-41 TaxID=3457704 RepID=UPI004034F47F
MNQTRYCSTCGTLLSEGAVICGECGARYQASPYERRATDTPGAWAQAPRSRARDLGADAAQAPEEEGIELVSRESLLPKNPGATALRTQEQYDQMMVTQPAMNQTGPGPAPGMLNGPGSPAPAPSAPGGEPMEPPLDGCVPGSLLRRFLAALVDSVIGTLVAVPLTLGMILILTSDTIGLLPQILVGVGVALPVAYTVLMIWLAGSKGFTLGKLILGLRITKDGVGGPIGFVRALGRWALYGIIPLIMALSIFIDPKKHLRGLHDRVIGSVVVDIKAGRNPLQPRPDDFERESAAHYLGAPSVAVSTHPNLLSEPGTAWSGPSDSAPAQPVTGGWDGSQQMAPSPYAPPASSSSAPEAPMSTGWAAPPPTREPVAQQPGGEGGWAPPPVDPVPQQSWDQNASAPRQQSAEQVAPAPQQAPWDQPAPQQAPWDQPAVQQDWSRQDGTSQPQQQPQHWGQPAPQQSAAPAPYQDPNAAGTAGWAPPAPQGQPSAPGANSALDSGAQPSYGAPTPYAAQEQENSAPQAGAAGWGPASTNQEPVGTPGELTGDAWDAGIDEQTRLSEPDDSLGDLEQTRLSAVKLPAVKKLRLTADDGTDRLVEKAVVIGRNPSASGEEVLFVLKDDTRSVSKTHLRIDGTGEEITVTDLGSTNGSTILREDGSRENLVPNAPTVLPTGAQLTLGDRTLSVEREQ